MQMPQIPTETIYRSPESLRLSMDLTEEIKGLYRLLEVISEYGSNGRGNGHFRRATRGLADLPSM